MPEKKMFGIPKPKNLKQVQELLNASTQTEAVLKSLNLVVALGKYIKPRMSGSVVVGYDIDIVDEDGNVHSLTII